MANLSSQIPAPVTAIPQSCPFGPDHAWCAEKMVLSGDLREAAPLESFFASVKFQEAIDTYARASGGTDRRAVVSMWSLYYFSALAIPTIIAARLGRRLPVAMEDMRLALAPNGLPEAFGLADWGYDQESEPEAVWPAVEPLIDTHLRAAVAALQTYGGIAPKLSWNNAAVYLNHALTITAPQATHDAWAGRTLFQTATMPRGDPNPLAFCLRRETDGGESVCRRKVCCLRYMLPGIASCGSLCALPARRDKKVNMQ